MRVTWQQRLNHRRAATEQRTTPDTYKHTSHGVGATVHSGTCGSCACRQWFDKKMNTNFSVVLLLFVALTAKRYMKMRRLARKFREKCCVNDKLSCLQHLMPFAAELYTHTQHAHMLICARRRRRNARCLRLLCILGSHKSFMKVQNWRLFGCRRCVPARLSVCPSPFIS